MSVDEQIIPPYLTDAEWREFQAIPDQGYSHRHWVDYRIHLRVEQAKREAAAEALEEAADYFEEEMTRPVEGWVRDYLRRRAAAIRTEPTS